MEEIMQRITEVFRVVFEDETLVIAEETNTGDIKEWDSLKHLSLLAMLEKEFHIKFDVDDIVSMEKVGDMAHLIYEKG